MFEMFGWRVGKRETEVRLYGWCECATSSRGMTLEAARQCAKGRKEWSPGTYVTEWVSRGHICLACVISDRPPVLWWFTPGEGRDTVTWCGWDKQYKGRNYWKSTHRCQVDGLMGVSLTIVCVCVFYLTWHDYPSMEGESHCRLLLLWIVWRGEDSSMFLVWYFLKELSYFPQWCAICWCVDVKLKFSHF